MKKFVATVQIATIDSVKGDEKSRKKLAENSAASSMISTLQDSGFV